MAFNTVRTVYNIGLETAKMLGVPYKPLESSTLNEYFNLNYTSASSEYPTLSYFSIGLRFDDILLDRNLEQKDITRDVDDIYLQRPIPFLAVKKSIGLTRNEMDTYRLIIEKEINGEVYLLCYLKRFNKETHANGFYKIIFKDNRYIPSKIELVDINRLNSDPNPTITLDKDEYSYIGYRHTIDLYLTDIEIENIKIASDLLYPNVETTIRYRIGEIALVSGVETVVDGRAEVADAQSAWFTNTDIILNNLTTGQSAVKVETIDIGGLAMKFKDEK